MDMTGSITCLLAFTATVFFAALIELVNTEQSWSYLVPENGPNTWPQKFPQCGGKMQSPINIRTKHSQFDGKLNDLNLQYRNQTSIQLLNDGNTIRANVFSTNFNLTGADLGHRFRLVQVHFHWGRNDSRGSEHQIDGVKYPMEMHLVHFNADKYQNFTTAMKKPDGLAVVSVLFEPNADDNSGLNQITQNLRNVSFKGDQIIIKAFSVRDLLLKDISSKFYRYNGSLTTPGCYESVKWFVLQQTVAVSQKQLHMFRGVFMNAQQETKSKKLVDNFRPVQALNGRTIRKNFDTPSFCGKKSNLTADCRKIIDKREVYFEVEVNACSLPVSLTFKVSVPGVGFNRVVTVSEDLKIPIKIWNLKYGVTLETHFHSAGPDVGKLHVTVYRVPLPYKSSADSIKIMEEYFTVEGVCKHANCTTDSWDKHWCTSIIGYTNDTLALGFSSVLHDQCGSGPPNMRVKIYRREFHPKLSWVWTAVETFRDKESKVVGLTNTILHGDDGSTTRGRRNSAVKSRWSQTTLEAHLDRRTGTNFDFSLYMITDSNGGHYLIFNERYTYPRSTCNAPGSSTGRKIAIGVSVVLVVVVMISVTVGLMYRKRQLFLGHRPTLVDEMEVHDADRL